MSLATENIETLLVLCQKGNQLAQVEIYNRYNQAMYNTSLRIVKNTAEAEDVMQESFITAFDKLHTYKGDAAFGSWLKRIVINNSISQYRKSQRFVKMPDNFGEEYQEDAILEESGENDFSQLKVKQVMRCMDDLNDNYKNALNLHFVEGYDYEELCDILKISYSNCRTLISRAKESLRKKLVLSYG